MHASVKYVKNDYVPNILYHIMVNTYKFNEIEDLLIYKNMGAT